MPSVTHPASAKAASTTIGIDARVAQRRSDGIEKPFLWIVEIRLAFGAEIISLHSRDRWFHSPPISTNGSPAAINCNAGANCVLSNACT
jgi:hypothetical protein